MSTAFPGIEKLKNKINKGSSKYHFSKGNSFAQIELMEKAYGLLFPDSFKMFLNCVNGGMICEYEDHYYIDMTDWEPDGPKESSFYFFSLNEIIDEYRDFRLDDVFVEEGFKGQYPFIPICKTPNQGLIFILSQRGLKAESPVFISYHDRSIKSALQIAKNFDNFISYHLDHEGFPPLNSVKSQTYCLEFLEKYKVIEKALAKETSQEIIIRNSALIQINPKDGMSYIERGSAYCDEGQRELAIIDYNKAIEIDPQDAFYRYYRGEFLNNYGSKRKALIDLDIAVQLKPNDHLYLIARADIFYELKRYDQALKDCNSLLESNWRDTLALSLRVRVYRALGKDKKADEDANLLNDLYG